MTGHQALECRWCVPNRGVVAEYGRLCKKLPRNMAAHECECGNLNEPTNVAATSGVHQKSAEVLAFAANGTTQQYQPAMVREQHALAKGEGTRRCGFWSEMSTEHTC
jgi:hypothetical protein